MKLKEVYESRCQICGARALELYKIDVAEVYHINYFALTANNNASNIMILCPNHHRIVHKAKPVFDLNHKLFEHEK